MENGFFRIGSFGRAPIRIHWSAPLGAFFFGGFRFSPAAWLAFLILILVHELGHALIIRAFKLEVVSVNVHGIGGDCQWYGSPSPIQRALISWGGVFGQMVLLLIALPLSFLLPPKTPHFVMELVSAFLMTNLYLMAINLLPIPGFDGAEAWKLFGKNGIAHWWKWRKKSVRRPPGGPGPYARSKSDYKPFSADDILEKTPTGKKRPPKEWLN
ncbi:MAG: M50 family metallopeptidase [Polyangiaceae bacterium]|nr:M50 family metallopeptidase [Polyangiaceae bacterium]